LIYHAAGRTQRQWEQHLMQVNAAGQFTGKWLFDAVILTTQDIDGQDIMYASLSGSQINDLLTQEFAEAAALDSAAAALAAQYGAPPKPIQLALALPWLSPQDVSLSLLGITLNLSIPLLRTEAATSYLQQVQSMAQAANWWELSLYGIYYQREDASTAWGDPAYIAGGRLRGRDLAVFQDDDGVGDIDEVGVVRGDQRGDAFGLHHDPQQPHDLLGGLRVELAGGLVCEQQVRAAGQRAGDRDPLLLAAGQLAGPLFRVPAQAHEVEHEPDPFLPLGGRRAGDPQRDADVLRSRQDRDETERLEDERDRRAAQPHPVPFGHRGHVTAGHLDAAGVGVVEAADDVEQRGLAGPGPAPQGHELPGRDGEGDATQ